MNNGIPLSVAIITKDEVENLPRCLGSVAFADQVVVVDSGSSDDTVSIATACGCDVFVEEWRGFGPQKQMAVDRCRNDWILVLDADERIPPETADVIKKIVNHPPEAEGYSFPRKNFFQGRWIKHAGWWPDRVVRLFRRSCAGVTCALVHEAVEVKGKVVALDVSIEHFTDSRLNRILLKINIYSTLGAEAAFAEGKSASLLSAYMRAKLTFLYNYFVRLGFLDRSPGFTLAVLDGINKFFKYAKLAELTRQKSGDHHLRSPQE
ncbi:MAG TPA: glycosyltransferase family 2 protein [Syntrophales bacterium]|nr:glycosyltransferase family 2 protein [Syntrophales bacterium]